MLTNQRDGFRGHSRSHNVISFDMLCIVSYCCTIVTLSPGRTVFLDIRHAARPPAATDRTDNNTLRPLSLQRSAVSLISLPTTSFRVFLRLMLCLAHSASKLTQLNEIWHATLYHVYRVSKERIVVELTDTDSYSSPLHSLFFPISALTLLVGRQEGHPAYKKNWMLVCWW